MLFLKYSTLIITICLFVGIFAMDYLGFRTKISKNPKGTEGLGTMEGALLGLLGLLLAFTFNLSSLRYDARRQAVVEEANIIGTALLRSDLYPDSIKCLLKADFKQYIEARINYYEVGNDEAKIQEALNKSMHISQKIWNRVAELSQKKENYLCSMQMIPALNNMIDIVTSRDDKRLAHVPESILYLLFILCLTSSFIIGYGRKSQKMDWIIVSCFAIMISITVYLILDLDQSRSGIITTDIAHHKMLELRKMLK
jgi:hypothetical protein